MNLDGQIREQFFLEFPEQVVLVFGGRNSLYDCSSPSWREDMHFFEMCEFNEEECKSSLRKRGIRNEALTKAIYEFTRGVPLAVSLAAETSLRLPSKAAAVDLFRDKPTELAGSMEIISHVTERFLNLVHEDEREIVDVCAILGQISYDALEYLLNRKLSKDERKRLEQYSFIRRHGANLLFHKTVRIYLLRTLKKNNPTYFKGLQNKAAQYADKQLNEMNVAIDDRFSNQQWRIWALERIYHLLQANPDASLEEFYHLFSDALWEREFEFCLALVGVTAEPLSSSVPGADLLRAGCTDCLSKDYLEADKSLLELLGLKIESPRFLQMVHDTLGDLNNNDRLNNIEQALEHYEIALDYFFKFNEPQKAAITLLNIAKCLRSIGKWGEAISKIQESIELRRAVSEKTSVSYALWLLADTYEGWNKFDEAIETYRDELALLTTPEQANSRARTLYQIAYCLHHKPQPEWDEAIKTYRDELALLTTPEKSDSRAASLYQIAYCLYNKPQPEWDEAINHYREALTLQTTPEKSDSRARTLFQIAYCLHNKPQPEWDEAIKYYLEELDYLTAPERANSRVITLKELAYCLANKLQPEWDAAIKYSNEALALLSDTEQANNKADIIHNLGYCLISKSEPEWEEALKYLREELPLLDLAKQVDERADTLYGMARCLHKKPQPEWDEAIKYYRETLVLRTLPEKAINRAITLDALAHCLHEKPQPEWDEAITCFQEELALFTAPEHATPRANALYQIAYCLSNKPQREWDEAINCLREALSLLISPEQMALRTQVLWIIANDLEGKPQPEWNEALTFYQEALALLTAPNQSESRANILYRTAFCLHNKPQSESDEAIITYHKAVENFTQAIKQQPEDGDTYFGRGKTYWRLKEYNLALDDFSAATKLQTKDAVNYAWRGRTYHAMGMNAEAETDFAQVREFLENGGDSAYIAAASYAHILRVAEACDWLRIAFSKETQLFVRVQSDKDFDPIRDSKEFQKLIAENESRDVK